MRAAVGRIEIRQVLYVEDQATNALIMRGLFTHRPHLQLLVTEDARRARALAPSLSPSLLLIDQQLPDALGSELLVELRERQGWDDVPAIAVTADCGFDGRGTEFAEIWRKPLDLLRVLDRLDHWVPLPPSGVAAARRQTPHDTVVAHGLSRAP